MGAAVPVITMGAKVLGAVSTISNILGGASEAPEPQYLPAPAAPEAAEPVVAPQVATEEDVAKDTTTSEEASRQRALRRKRASSQNITMLNRKNSDTASVLTSTLFGS